MLLPVEDFRLAHQKLGAALDQADAAPTAQLLDLLKAIREEVLAHFKAKDAFYPSLAAHLTEAGDVAGAQLARIFEQNMKIQSAAVQRYFEGLERAAPQTSIDGFKTVALVMRQRFQTEEKAVFPLTVRKEPRGKR